MPAPQRKPLPIPGVPDDALAALPEHVQDALAYAQDHGRPMDAAAVEEIAARPSSVYPPTEPVRLARRGRKPPRPVESAR